MEKMTKRQRILCAVRGEKPDELPLAFWTHLPGVDRDPERLADATYAFFREYDVDLIKTMNNGMYCVEDFGCMTDDSAVLSGGAAGILSTPIKTARDWRNVEPASVSAPALSRELRSLKLLLKRTKDDDVPVLFTLFSPMTIAAKMSNGQVVRHIREGEGDAVKVAMEAITQTTCALAREAVSLGADGVYFATQMSDESKMSEAEYLEYGAPYDRRVLLASSGTCDAIHAHGDHILFNVLKTYPADIFNWHVFESEPTLGAGSRGTGRCVMGGLKRGDVTGGDLAAIERQIRVCLNELDGRGHILSPGCVVRYPLDAATLHAIREIKRRVEREE